MDLIFQFFLREPLRELRLRFADPMTPPFLKEINVVDSQLLIFIAKKEGS